MERTLRRSVVALALLMALVIAAFYPLTMIWNESRALLPHRLMVGDSWTYKVVFPDSKSYEMTESVREIIDLNGTEVYLLFRDDAQHLSTEYLWITLDWHEVKTFTPNIGNLLANSTTTYTPPVQLFQVPFRVGDQWTVKSAVRTITKMKSTTIDSTALLLELRTTSSRGEVSTPLRQFHAFKVAVMKNGTLFEALWFDTELGQVVYGEFYNDHEKVTQTLIGHEESTNTTSTAANAFLQLAAETRLFQQNRGWKTFASYI